jgi:hypothetical protein
VPNQRATQRNDLCREALELLLQFAEHPTSANTLIEIGAIDFLLQLEANSRDEEEWGDDVRPVLDALQALPQSGRESAPPGFDHLGTESAGASARSSLHTVDEVPSSLTSLPPSRGPTTTLSTLPADRVAAFHRPVEPALSVAEDSVIHGSIPDFVRTEMTGTPHPLPSEGGSTMMRESGHHRQTSSLCGSAASAMVAPHRGSGGGGGGGAASTAMAILRSPCSVIVEFNPVALSDTDQQILRTTALNLQDGTTAVEACAFFCDELLVDFPAEVFLQSPTVLHSLVRLLGNGQLAPDAAEIVRARALTSLVALTSALHHRMAVVTGAEASGKRHKHRACSSKTHPVSVLFLCHALFVQATGMLHDRDELANAVLLLSAALPLLAQASAVDVTTGEVSDQSQRCAMIDPPVVENLECSGCARFTLGVLCRACRRLAFTRRMWSESASPSWLRPSSLTWTSTTETDA